MTSQSTLTTEQKIDYIFNYIQKHQANSDLFWNQLSQEELLDLSKIKKEDTVSLHDLS